MKTNIFLLILLLFFATQAVVAQWYDPEKVNKKAQFVYSGAIDQLRDGQMESGKKLLHAALKLDPRFVDAWLSLAGACGQMKQYDSAVMYYEKSFSLDSVYTADMKLSYSINLAGMGRFEDAGKAVQQFLALPRLDPRSVKAGEYRLRC